MPDFRYTARSADGKLVDGVVTCNDRAAAIRQVEQQRFVPIKIELASGSGSGGASTATAPDKTRRKPAPALSDSDSANTSGRSSKSSASGEGTPGARSSRFAGPTSRFRDDGSPAGGEIAPAEAANARMSHAQQFLFTEQLGNLLNAGMTLDEALSIMERRLKHPRLNVVARGLHQALVDGRSLSQALRDYPRIFSPLYVNMVGAGEVSGALAEILRRLTKHLAEVKGLRDRVQFALLYPAFLVLAGIGLIIVFVTVMVPQLTGFFKETGGNLPTATRLLLGLNDILTHYWWAFLAGIAALWSIFKAVVRTPAGRMAWDTFVWNMPVIGGVLRYRYYAQFARTMGTLAENGVTLLRALGLLEEISGNEFVRARMVQVRSAVVDGATLSVALAEQQLFPELFIDMMAVGEQTGRFGITMNNIADVYERELDKQVKILGELIPPIVMLLIAGVVGFVVFGVLSAVFGLTQGLRAGGH